MTICESCEAVGTVARAIRSHSWPYGDGQNGSPQLLLSACVPVHTCTACDESFLDYEAEAIIDFVTKVCVKGLPDAD